MIEIKDHVNGHSVCVSRQELRGMLTGAALFNYDQLKERSDATVGDIFKEAACLTAMDRREALERHVLNWEFCDARREELDRIHEALEFGKQQKRS